MPGVDDAIGGDVSIAQADLDILNDVGDESENEPDGGEAPETPETPSGEETPAPPTREEPPAREEEEETDEVTDPNAPPPEERIEERPEDKALDAVPDVKAIKVKYPTFFKDFPNVRGAIFRDQQFREFIPTPEDAKELVERGADFDEYEQKVMSGDSTLLFNSLAATSPEVLEKFAMNLLPTLEKISPQLNGKILFPYVRRIFTNALSDAKASGNKNLENSIGHIARYLWNTTTVPEEAAPARTEETPEVKRLREELDNTRRQHADTFMNNVIDNGVKEFRKAVDFTFSKDTRFSSIEKKALVDDIVLKSRAALDKDPRYGRAMKVLWSRVGAAGFPTQMLPRVVNTFLGGARSVLPAIRAKVVADALRAKGIAPPAKGQLPGSPRGGSPQGGGRGVSSNKIDYSKTSDADILSDDPARVKLKGK